jgi:hypothetical protein
MAKVKCPLPFFGCGMLWHIAIQVRLALRPCFSFPSCPLPLVRHLSSDQPYLPTRREKYEYTNSEGRMKVRTEKSRRKAWSLNADVEIKARLSMKGA